MTTNNSIVRATRADIRNVTDVLTLAFSSDPVVRWMYPDPTEFLAAFPQFIGAFGGVALDHGTAWCVEGWSGAALWLSPFDHIDEAALSAVLNSTVDDPKLKDFSGALAQMASYHPAEAHWYLPLIGIDPVLQSKGLGSALMLHMLSLCDYVKTIAYLESSNVRNIPLYERLGFESLGRIESGGCPPIFPMLRWPR